MAAALCRCVFVWWCVVRACDAEARLFVTLLGYPSTCERGRASHACTLSLACWLVGGSSQPGCGANPWLVACCVTDKTKMSSRLPAAVPLPPPPLQYPISADAVDFNEIHRSKVEDAPLLQRRVDEGVPECGVSADRIMHRRIIGGREARFAQFPWQAHIRIAAYQCGGVLVSRNFVVTAAHCIIRARTSLITVFLGELDTQDTGQVLELAPAEHHSVRRKIIHPDFQLRSTQPDRYDVALLEMMTSAGHTFYISPVCLPTPGTEFKGMQGLVAGWGKIKPSTELTGTNVLRSATVPILDKEECVEWHRSKQIHVELFEDMVCAGHADGHQDACLGDSGGPLIVLLRGRWTLAGITSAGFGCGEPHQPGIYHNVARTASWIRAVVTGSPPSLSTLAS